MTRSSKRVREELWRKVVEKVRAHGGEVPRFIDLLNEEGMGWIYSDKEYHRALPYGDILKYGFTGENTAAWTTTTEWNGMVHNFPAMVFEDFDMMMKRMDEDVNDNFIFYGTGKIKTHTDMFEEWSFDAVKWSEHMASMYYNILTGNFAFGEIDESLKLPVELFKDKSKAPRTFEEAFPNIYKLKLARMITAKNAAKNAAKKRARNYPEDDNSYCTTPTTPLEKEQTRLETGLSKEDLAKVVASLGDHKKQRMYKQAEEKREERRTAFTKNKVQTDSGGHWYSGDLECNRYYQHIDVFLEKERRAQIKEFLAPV